MNRLLTFLQYHNAVPITLGILFLGAGATFAATNPEVIYSESQHALTEDNTYIANKDLASYTPRVDITAVTEDEDSYYVTYHFATIDAENYVWKDVVKEGVLEVKKSALGAHDDLGLYVTGQLKQNIDHEIDRLKEVQTAARRNMTQKTVATLYGGLVGKMLNDSTETLPGYTPVVVAPPPLPSSNEVASAAAAPTSQEQTSEASQIAEQPLTRAQIEALIQERVNELLAQSQSGGTPPPPPPAEGPGTQPDPSVDTEAPVITLSGATAVTIEVGQVYGDLGASVTDNVSLNLGIKASVDDGPDLEIGNITIDTSVAGEHTITYRATDQAGNIGSASRTVIVEATNAPQAPEEISPPQESEISTPESVISPSP